MWRSFLVLVLLAVLAVPCGAVTTPFTVTVPDRVNSAVLVPIAKVRLTLETGANAAGATLNIQNGAVNSNLNLSNLAQLLDPGNPASSDTVVFRQDASVPSRVHIELGLRHIMNDPANFCVLGITGPQVRIDVSQIGVRVGAPSPLDDPRCLAQLACFGKKSAGFRRSLSYKDRCPATNSLTPLPSLG